MSATSAISQARAGGPTSLHPPGLKTLIVGLWKLGALSLAFLVLGPPAAALAATEGPPDVPAAWVTDVTANSANLRATIQPNGLSTTYRFEYLTEAAFQAQGWPAAALAPPGGKANYGASPGPPAFQHLEHLQPGTVYRYRALATNSAGSTPSFEHLLSTEALPGAPPQCPNQAFRVGAGSGLPDCRAYELVSPPAKAGGAVAAPEGLFGGGEFQAAAGSGAITYSSATSFEAAQGAPPASQYLSARSAAGWSTRNISTPLDSLAYGDHPDGAPYRLFSTDLSSALLFGGLPCRTALPACPFPNPVLPGSGAPPGYTAYYLRDSAGTFSSLLSATDFAHSVVPPRSLAAGFAAANPGLTAVVLSSCASLTAEATELPDGSGGCQAAAQNLYRWRGGDLEAMNLLPGESATTPGAQLAAPLGALSTDGDRAYFTTPAGGPLYLYEAGSPTRLVPETTGGALAFQAASADGSLAYFTLAGQLYRYSVATETSAPLASAITGVLGVSADGATVYYQDAVGLHQWHEGSSALIAAGPDVALSSDYAPATATARLSSDGLHLAFLSNAEIPPFDNLDSGSGQPDTELYLYGTTPTSDAPELLCASCNPTGERPHGSSSIPGTLHNGTTAAYRPRALSADSTRLFFDSSDRLVTADTDASRDVYQWQAPGSGGCATETGCVSLISGGRSDSGRFIDASADGSDAYFLTGASLLEADPGSADIYDARIGGGLPEPPPPFVCLGDACQPLPGPPDDPSPGTATPNSGNPPLKYYKEHQKRHHRKKHHPKKHHQRRGHR